jgi:hypothetical protein
MMFNNEDLQHILDTLVEKYSWQPAKALWILETSWKDIAGDYVAKNTRVIGYKPKTLTLAVKSSSWSQDLQYFLPQLKDNVNKFLETTFVEQIQTRVLWTAFRPVASRGGTGEVSVRVGRIKPKTDNLNILIDRVEVNYHIAVKKWLNEGYQPCRACGSPTLKPYRLCSVCEKNR